MADTQKYYYMRLKEDFFDTEETKLLESLPDGYLYSNILLKLYLLSLKKSGRLMFNDRIPYSPQMIATLTRHQVGTVEKALGVLREFGFIEVLDTGAIYMLDIQSFIGQSSTEADRKREYRAQIAAEKTGRLILPLDNAGEEAELTAPDDNSGTNVQTDGQTINRTNVRTNLGQVADERVPENRDKRLEIRDKRLETRGDIEPPEAPPVGAPLPAEKHRIDYQAVVDLYNSICTKLPRVTALSKNRKTAIKARVTSYGMEKIKLAFEKAQASRFLTGGNARNWSASFDWIMNDTNLAKILDGNYDDKAAAPAPAQSKQAATPFQAGNEEIAAMSGLRKLHAALKDGGERR